MTSLVDTLDSKHKVSTANVDTSSAVVKPAKEIDESAAHVVGYGMVPLMKSSRAKPGSFEDRSRDISSCARTVCPFFRSALSHAAPFFFDVAGRFAPCIVNPISHQKNCRYLRRSRMVCKIETLNLKNLKIEFSSCQCSTTSNGQ